MTLVDIDRVINAFKKMRNKEIGNNVKYVFNSEQIVHMLEFAKEELNTNQKEKK